MKPCRQVGPLIILVVGLCLHGRRTQPDRGRRELLCRELTSWNSTSMPCWASANGIQTPRYYYLPLASHRPLLSTNAHLHIIAALSYCLSTSSAIIRLLIPPTVLTPKPVPYVRFPTLCSRPSLPPQQALAHHYNHREEPVIFGQPVSPNIYSPFLATGNWDIQDHTGLGKPVLKPIRLRTLPVVRLKAWGSPRKNRMIDSVLQFETPLEQRRGRPSLTLVPLSVPNTE